jgi:CO/xanthine dehydrogenase Mo-binding subunit
MSPIEQAPIETCGAIAAPEVNDRYVCYTSTQALFFSLGTAAKVLTTPSSRLHFVGGTVGGGFGGKVDSIHEPIAVLGAMLTGRPCKFAWDREEEMQVGAPRGAERWYIKDGVMRDGRIVARRFTGYFDSGAYTRLSSYAIIKGVGHLPGPYTIPNVYADVYCVFTNRTPATAMRGFGITGVDFAIEAHMDKVAETVGMNPIELRILNAYRDGDMKAHRRVAKNCALVECCQVVAEKAGIALSPAARAASSLHGGGGERAQIPAYTATDGAGRVEGYEGGNYARKGGAKRPDGPAPIAVPPTAPRQPAYAAPMPTYAAPAPAPQPAHRPEPPPPAAAPGPARSGPNAVLLPVRLQEALMALHRGRGFAAINYPIGMNLGGDPSQALVHSNPDGKFTVALSSIDLGQGMKSVTRQIAAETLGVPVEDVYVDTADSDTGPHCMGSFASRGTHRVGNAVIQAAQEARAVMLEAAAEEMEVDPGDLVTDGRGNIHVRGAPSRTITTMAACQAAQFKQGRTVSGRGIFLIPLSEVDPDTGEMTPVSCFAHAAMTVEVEVDDETGEVAVTDMKSAYEVGRALNPRLVEQQLRGGAWMGMSHAAWETTEPYYPDRSHGPVDFNAYLMPGPGDLAPHHISVLERPAPDGPYGGKGPGEMCANPVLPAVVSAVYDAVGVRIDELPVTPEKVLRALKAQGGARPRRRL